jgi:hypothetical protein
LHRKPLTRHVSAAGDDAAIPPVGEWSLEVTMGADGGMSGIAANVNTDSAGRYSNESM